MIRFACPGCSATFTVGDEKAGKTGKCPKCQSQFIIPEAPAEASPPPSSVAPRLPPPPPPPVDDNSNTVEVSPCPKCGSRLSVLPSDIGLDIECPNCQTIYKATRADAPPPPDTGSKSGSKSSSLVKLGSGSRRDDDDDDDDDDDRKSKKKRSRRDDDDDDEDDEDDRPRRKKKRRRRARGNYAEHRGGLLLALALIGMFAFFPCAIVAWVMANSDLQEIDAGRMDPEGRSMTHLAKILSIITVILWVLSLLAVCIIWVFVLGCFGAMAGAGAGAR